MEKLFLKKKYKLLDLWSVVEVIKKTYKLGDIFVGLSDENLSRDRMPHCCKKCYKPIIKAVEKFNKTQDITEINNINCQCQ